MYKRLELRKKVIVTLLIVALIPFLFICIFSYFQSGYMTTNEINKKVKLLAGQKEETFKIWTENVINNAKTLAETADVYNSFIELKESLNNKYTAEWFDKMDYYNEKREYLDSLMNTVQDTYGWSMSFLINKKGEAVYSTQRNLEGADLIEFEYAQKALNGIPNNSDIIFSESDDMYSTTIAAPINSRENKGEVIGAFCAFVKSESIAEIVISGIEYLGETADAYIVSRDGTLISAPKNVGEEEISINRKLNVKSVNAAVTNFEEGKTSFSENMWYKNHANKRVVGHISSLSIGDALVALIIEVEHNEVFKPLADFTKLMTVLAIVIMLFILITPLFAQFGQIYLFC